MSSFTSPLQVLFHINHCNTVMVTNNTSGTHICCQVVITINWINNSISFPCFFFDTVYQGGDRLHPVRRQRVQLPASGPAARHQRHHAVRKRVRFGCDGQLPEGRAAWPPGTGPDTPHRYTRSRSVSWSECLKCGRPQKSR